MITIRVNGEPREIADGTTVEALLAEVTERRDGVAVERNRAVVPRNAFAETKLADGDEIEVVTFVGGG